LLNHPFGIAVAPSPVGIVYVADSFNSIIQKFRTNTGDFIGSFGAPGSGDGQFSNPSGIAITSASTGGKNNLVKIYIVDTNNNRVQLFTSP
jgi:tripartite motif-containing protein 71